MPTEPPHTVLREDQFAGNTRAFEDLVAFMNEGSISAFTGAGVSAPLFPTWAKLLSDLLEEARSTGLVASKSDVAEFERQISSDPLEAATSIEEVFTRKVFRAKLAARFSNINGTRTPVHQAIDLLSLRSIVTLNYDDGHEVAYAARGRKPNSGRSQDAATLTRWVQGDIFRDPDTPILHLHGEIADPEKMIFTSDDYYGFYSSSLAPELIRQLWRSDRLLVIGFGFTDPFLTRLAESTLRSLLTDARHFAIIGFHGDDPISPLQRRSFIRKYRVTPIFYQVKTVSSQDQGYDIADHSDLRTILLSLPQRLAPADPGAPSGIPSHAPPMIVGDIGGSTPPVYEARSADILDAQQRLNADLFVGTSGRPLYVEPLLFMQSPDDPDGSIMAGASVNVNDVVHSSESYIIVTHPEYGGTTLARRLHLELTKEGHRSVLASAPSLPSYKKKLETLFPAEKSHGRSVLLLDNVDIAHHERLLREIVGLKVFDRFVLIVRATFYSASQSLAADQLPVAFQTLWLSNLSPGGIRDLATQFFETSDTDLMSATVHQIYEDLTALCIPATPANVIMYLNILHHESDFHPINRVQLVARYIAELLRRPSDAYRDVFSAKDKVETVSAFVFTMYRKGKVSYTEGDWYVFCKEFMSVNLLSFDDRALLSELIAKRVFAFYGTQLVFKYKFFHSYFLGRYIAARPKLVEELIERGEHLSLAGLVEVISELSPDNTLLVTTLVESLESSMQAFNERYISEEFDPFSEAEWITTNDEEEKLWIPLQERINQGPKNSTELDQIKRSLSDEQRATRQNVVVREYDQLERQIMFIGATLLEALRNPDNLDGVLKRRAVLAYLRLTMKMYQLALIFARTIAQKRYVIWHGLLFINEAVYTDQAGINKRASEIVRMSPTIMSQKLVRELGLRKLGEVFKALANDKGIGGFLNYLNFSCLIRTKPPSWYDSALELIARMDRKAFYLRYLLSATLRQHQDEINTGRERDELKRVFAAIRIKRRAKKNYPGESDLTRELAYLEKKNAFKTSDGAAHSPAGPLMGALADTSDDPLHQDSMSATSSSSGKS